MYFSFLSPFSIGVKGKNLLSQIRVHTVYLSNSILQIYSCIVKPNCSIFRPQGYKTFSMLNSAEHGILNARKSKNIKKFCFF